MASLHLKTQGERSGGNPSLCGEALAQGAQRSCGSSLKVFKAVPLASLPRPEREALQLLVPIKDGLF